MFTEDAFHQPTVLLKVEQFPNNYKVLGSNFAMLLITWNVTKISRYAIAHYYQSQCHFLKTVASNIKKKILQPQ